MTLSIEDAKELLWDFTHSLTDEEVIQFFNQCKRMASIIVDYAEQEITKDEDT